MYCNACGSSRISPNDVFCPDCGCEVGSYERYVEPSIYSLPSDYLDGRAEGSALARYMFGLWQGPKGPPYSWPEQDIEIKQFVESCVDGNPMLMTTMHAKVERDVRAFGIDPSSIPHEYAIGLEEGFREGLTQLLWQFLPDVRKAEAIRLRIEAEALQGQVQRASETLEKEAARRRREEEANRRRLEEEAARRKLEQEAQDRFRRDAEAAHWNYWHNPANPWNNPGNTSIE